LTFELRVLRAVVDLFGNARSIVEMKAACLLLAILAAVAAAGDLLVRVEPASDADIELAAALGAGFLQRFDGWFLVRADAPALATLSDRLDCRVLARDPDGRRYVYANVEPGTTRTRLAECGTVLTEDRTGALLRVDAAGVRKLTRLPVELCGVSTVPPVGGRAYTVNRTPYSVAAVTDSLIWELMARASQDSSEATLRRLIGFHTRYALAESCWAASRWFESKLAAYGCDSTFLDSFLIPYEGPSINVVGVKRGRVSPELIHIISGHIDCTSEIPEVYAPGSDDNASGAGLVLEAARVFQGVEFDCTVWFVGFGAEEFGLVGSDTMARECRARGDSIVLLINHDMDSYGCAGRDSIRVVGKRTNPPCSTWVVYYMAMADTFTDLKCHMEIVDEQSSSDQASFWKYGYHAIRDRYLDRDPVYHTTGDTIGPFQYQMCGTNNIPMYTEAIKATVATIAKLAGAHQHVGVEESSKPQAPGLKLAVLPSVGRTPVSIHLSSAAPVSVFDAAGRLIRVLPAGASLWDGHDESGAPARAGVYYFRAASGAAARFILAR